jgi:ribosomal protein S18 acetylase RimI-like enzyme
MPDIRVAEVRDARPLAELAEETFRATFAALNTPQDMELHCQAHYSEVLQLSEILDSAMTTLVSEQGGVLIGYVQLRWGQSTDTDVAQRPIEIRRLYVTKAWQGRGVAQDLMAAAMRLAEDQGADQVWLGVWERNPRAIAFYKKCGFAEVGEHKFLLGTDTQCDVVMQRPVGA